MGLRRNKKLKTWLGSQPVRVAVGQVSRGLGARALRGLGPLSNHDFRKISGWWKPGKASLGLRFSQNFWLVGAWQRRGCRLKRVLRRWGPGGKRSRDTPPTPPPHPPPRFGAVRRCWDPKCVVFVGKRPIPWWAGPQALGARAPSPPGDLAHRPLGPG